MSVAAGTKDGKWATLTGAVECSECDWTFDGDNNERRLLVAARWHAASTGHRVVVERGQRRWVRSETTR